MATKRDLTKAYAREYARADKKTKGVMLDQLCDTTGWSRVNARRAIRQAAARKGRADQQRRKPRPRKYSYDALKLLTETWTLAGEPCGKYLAPIVDDTLERLLRFRELGKVADRISDETLAEVRAMSPATMDRYLKPVKAARYPQAASTTRPGLILRASIPLRTAMDGFPQQPGFLEIDTVAHCGHRNEGDYLVTINATGPHLGWGVMTTVRNKAFCPPMAAFSWLARTANASSRARGCSARGSAARSGSTSSTRLSSMAIYHWWSMKCSRSCPSTPTGWRSSVAPAAGTCCPFHWTPSGRSWSTPSCTPRTKPVA